MIARCRNALAPLAVAALSLAPHAAPRQSGDLLVDLNTTELSTFTGEFDGAIGLLAYEERDSFVKVGSNWYFEASGFATGLELFRTDGTAAGTELVRDIYPGITNAGLGWFTAFNGLLYFVADDGVHGTELWSSDGTESGTQLVIDINPGPASGSVRGLRVVGGTLYFSAFDPAHGSELWSSDGTASGTQLVADIFPGVDGGLPAQIHPSPIPGEILFRGRQPGTGFELWASDGTAAGTRLVRDVQPGPSSSLPLSFTSFAGEVYFPADDGVNGEELWKTDGTTAGTVLLRDLLPGSPGAAPDLTYAAVFAGHLYFSAESASTVGRELHRTDGTAAGTQLFADLYPGGQDGFPEFLVQMGGDLYFVARSGQSFLQRDLWRLAAGGVPTVVTGFAPPSDTQPTTLVAHNDHLWWGANFGSPGLYTSDGTAAGTQFLSTQTGSETGYPDWITPLDPTRVLFVDGSASFAEELWTSDGTAAGTGFIANGSGLNTSSEPNLLFSPDGERLFFTASDGVNGREPWVWSESGGAILLEADPGPQGISPFPAFVYGFVGGVDRIFFRTAAAGFGTELWTTDGTPAGTRLVRDINPSPDFGSDPDSLTPWNGRLYFSADDGSSGAEVWSTDGTDAGTAQLIDLVPGSEPSRPRAFAAVAGELWFAAATGPFETDEIWVTDGTAPGTQRLFGAGASLPFDGVSEMNPLGDRVVITARGSGPFATSELWATDGTLAGTELLFGTGSFGGVFADTVHRHRDEIYFAGDDFVVGTELWKTDGTFAGTTLVADLNPAGSSSPTALASIGEDVYLWARSDSVSNYRLWRTDGTPGGTSQVSLDLFTFNPEPPTPAAGGAYFPAIGDFGLELYFSDGTPLGTTLVDDVFEGVLSSSPSRLIALGGDLLFTALSMPGGDELHRLDGAGATSTRIGASGNGSILVAGDPRLGSSVALEVFDAPAGALVHLVVLGTPLPAGIPFLTDPGSALWLDPASAFNLGTFGGATAQLTVPIGAAPALVGAEVNLQAVSIPPSVLPISTSAGQRWTLDF